MSVVEDGNDSEVVGVGVAWENAWRTHQSARGSHDARDGDREVWVEQWCALTREGLEDPLSWALAGFTPADASVWLGRAATHGWEQWVALQWAASGVKIERVFVDAGICPQERPLIQPYLPSWGRVRRWLTPHTPTMVRLALAEAWEQHNIPVEIADRWRRLGFFSPARAASWRGIGFSPLEAAQWELVGVSAADAVATRAHRVWVEIDEAELSWEQAGEWSEWGEQDEWDDDWSGDGDWGDWGEPTHR